MGLLHRGGRRPRLRRAGCGNEALGGKGVLAADEGGQSRVEPPEGEPGFLFLGGDAVGLRFGGFQAQRGAADPDQGSGQDGGAHGEGEAGGELPARHRVSL